MKKKSLILSTLIAAAATMTTSAFVYADAAYTATGTGINTGSASLTNDAETGTTLSGENIDLSSFTGNLELSGSATGDNKISNVTNNGGYGGRVSFKSGTYPAELTKIILNGGIEADITNIQSQSGLTIHADNASFFGSTSDYVVNLDVGDGGVRLNGGSGNNYKFTGAITGSGNIYYCTGNADASKTNTFTGDVSAFTGTWTHVGSNLRTLVFGDGTSGAVSGKVGGTIGTADLKESVRFNYTGNYEIGTVYGNAVTIAAGTATIGDGKSVSATNLTVASGASLAVASTGTLDLSSATVSLSSAIANSGTVTVDGSTVFDLSFLSAVDNVYTVIDGGTITNWENLTKTNFNRGGNAIAERQTLTVDENGTVTISGMLDLTWAGTEGNSAWVIGSGDNWTNSSSESTHFEAGDSVTFTGAAASKTVSIANGTTIAVGNMTVASGEYTFESGTSGNMATIAGNTLTVSSGATMNVGANNHKLNLDFNDIQLAGTINLKTNNGVTNIKWDQVTFNGGEIHIDDIGSDLTIDKVVMTGAGSITQTWGAPVILNLIAGSGDLTLGKATYEEKEYRIYGFDNYSGKLTLGGNTIFSASTVGNSAMKALEITGANASVIFKKASGETSTTYNISGTGDADGIISMTSNNSSNRTITIDEGVIVNAKKLNNAYGYKTLTVNGELNLSEIRNASGGVTNTITGTGTINTTKMTLGNSGAYVLDGGIRMNIGSDGIAQDSSNIWGYSLQIKNATIGASADWSSDSNIGSEKFKLGSGAKFDTNNHTITLNSVISNIGTEGDNIGALTKVGAGTLILNAENTFSGGVTINEGTVQVGNDSALGTGTVTIGANGALNVLVDQMSLDNIAESSAGTLNIGDATMSVTATRNYGSEGEGLGLGNVTVAKNSTLALVLSGNRWGVSFNGGLLGTLDVSGDADLVFKEGESLSGATLIVAENTSIYGYNSLSFENIELSGEGTLNTNQNGNGAATLTLAGTNTISVATIAGESMSSIKIVSGTTTISSNMSDFAGTLAVDNGAVLTVNGDVAPNALVALSGTLSFDAEDVSISSKISGDGTINGNDKNLTLGGDLSEFSGNVSSEQLTIAGDAGTTSASIAANTLLVKGTALATASLTLDGGQLNVGSFVVEHGKLSGATFANGKTLTANVGAALENVTFADGSTLTVAQGGVALEDVTFAEGSTLTVAQGGSLTFTGTNTLAGTLEVFNTVDEDAMITVAAGTTNITQASFNLKLSELKVPETAGTTVTYNIFATESGATLDGWDALKKGNITVEGVDITDAHVKLGFVESGKIEVSLNSADLTYAGGESGTWEIRKQGDIAWTTAEGTHAAFFNFDNVTFETSDARVAVNGDVVAKTMTVNENLVLTGLGNDGNSVKAINGVALATDKELSVSLSGTGTAFSGTTVTGTNSTFAINTNGNDVAWSESFAGTTLAGTGMILAKKGLGTLTIDADIGLVDRINIANGALALSVAAGTEKNFETTIAGSGTLAKTGAGTLVISRQNSLFTGETQINEGALKLTHADAIGGGDLTINPNGEVILAFTTGEFKNTVLGDGKLTIDVGTGVKMNLSSNNSAFKGTLNVASGTAIASNANSLGDNTNIASGATLEVTAAELSSKFTGEGTLNVISNGAVVKMSGDFVNFAGTFNVGNGTQSGALEVVESLNAAINVNLDSTLIFNIANDETATFSEAITTTNQSALKKQGAGTLVLSSQDNKILADEITIEAGTLKALGANAIGNANAKIKFSGDAAADAIFEFAALPIKARTLTAFAASSIPTATETFANSVSGTGKTVFSGGGVVDVTGLNEATGGVDVIEATTIVTNGMNNVGTGAVNIANGAWYAKNHDVVIGGNGVDSVTMGASGSLYVGSATFTGTALNDVKISAAGTEIEININSLSDLNRVHVSGGSIDFTGSIVIETASGIDLNGKVITLFASNVDLVNGTPTIIVNGDSGVYNMISDGTNIVLSATAIVESFNLGYSSMVAMSRDVFGQDAKALHNRMETRRFETRELGNTEFFAQMQGSTIDNGNDVKKSGRFDYNTYGALVGGDLRIAVGTLVGFALGYDHGKADIHDNQGKIEMDNYRVTAFASQLVGNYTYVEGGISAGTASYELTRTQSKVRESLNGYNVGAFVRVGAVVPVTSAFSILPYAGLSTCYTTMDDFQDGVYDVDSADAISLRASVGASLRYDFEFSATNKSSLTFDLAYACELADDELETKAKTGTTNFKRKEIIDNDDFLSVGAEFSTTIGNGASVFMGYSADIGEDVVHHANAGLRYKF